MLTQPNLPQVHATISQWHQSLHTQASTDTHSFAPELTAVCVKIDTRSCENHTQLSVSTSGEDKKMLVAIIGPRITISYCLLKAPLYVKFTLEFKNRQHNSVSLEGPSLLITINLSSEQGAGSQSWPLKFEHDLTLCLQLSNVSATTWLLSSSGFSFTHPWVCGK